MATTHQQNFIKLEMPSEIKSIYILNAISKHILTEMQFSEEDTEQVNLAIIEAGANAIKHGNRNDPDKKVNVQFHVGFDKLTVIVQDEGEGFDTNNLPEPLAQENLLKPNGRGVFAMKQCMDEVTFNNNGSEVQMVKFINSADAAK